MHSDGRCRDFDKKKTTLIALRKGRHSVTGGEGVKSWDLREGTGGGGRARGGTQVPDGYPRLWWAEAMVRSFWDRKEG